MKVKMPLSGHHTGLMLKQLKKPKEPSVRWLRRWHKAIIREIGTDDIAQLIEHKRIFKLAWAASELNRKITEWNSEKLAWLDK